MSDNLNSAINGKILFGTDYLNLMRFMELPREDEKVDKDFDIITDAIMKFFLLQWDFSVKEIDKSNELFYEKVNKNELDDLEQVIERIYGFLKDDKQAQEKFIIQMTTIGLIDNNVTEDERWIANHFQSKFDFRPSEFDKMIGKANDWCAALNYLGHEYFTFLNKKK